MLSLVQRSSNWTLNPAAQPRFRSSAHARLHFRVCRRERHQNPDPAHALALLGTRREGACSRRAAEQRNELASPHIGSKA
jgi:hypothetical protein